MFPVNGGLIRAIAAIMLCAGIFCLSHSHAQVPMTGAGLGAPASAVSTTAYDPSKKGTNVVLSNSNLTATAGASETSYETVLSVHGQSSGLIYFETLQSSAASTLVGIANGSFTFGSGNFLGVDTNGIGWFGASGQVFVNGSALTPTIQTYAAGDTAGVAYDLGHSKIWFITYHGSCGNWNNDVIGNQNPANNTGGFTLSGLAGGPYFAGSTRFNPGASSTANFGASSYLCQPAGYSNQ